MARVSKRVKSISKQRLKTLEHVEIPLLLCITEKSVLASGVSEEIICEKAIKTHADHMKNQASRS